MNLPCLQSPRIQAQFATDIAREFIQGSAIAPDLYQTATCIVSDTEILPGGDVAYPIHEALNRGVTRFGYQARETLQALLFLNEDGSTWQAKLSQPTLDPKKGKLRKYETPLDNGSRAYLPPINRETRRLIAQRYDVEVPPPHERFWDWLQQHPEIPIVLTEGGKKSLSLLSQGYVAIALYGVNGGYLKLPGDTRELIPDLMPFCQPERSFRLAFDQDEKDSTRRQVNVAIHRFGGLLAQTDSEVKVTTWEASQGKGVDDLVVQGGAAAWDAAYTQALPLEHWQILQHLKRTLTIRGAIRVSTTDLETLDPATLPDQGIIAIASGKGTGKTKLVQRIVKASDKALAVVHRIALARNLSVRLGLDYRGDLDKAKGKFINGSGYTLRVGSCIDSLLAIDPKTFAGCDLIIDEVVQVIRHLLMSSTCAKDGRRPALLARLHQLIQVARRVIVADADLDNATVHYLQQLRNDGQTPFLIHNTQSLPGYEVLMLHAPDRSVIVGRVKWTQVVRQF